MSLLHGKMEIDTGIKAEATKFHDVFSCRPHHVSNATPEKIQGCELHDGDWGKAGSTICWNYYHDGEAKVAKEVIEAIDDEKNSTTFRVVEGDLIKLYKDFVITVQATQMDWGSWVHWTLEYERLSMDVPDPFTLLEFCAHVTRDIDAHLTAPAETTS